MKRTITILSMLLAMLPAAIIAAETGADRRALLHEYSVDNPYLAPSPLPGELSRESLAVQSAGDYTMTFLGSTLWSEVREVAIADTLAFLGLFSGLMILDVSDPNQPTFVSKLYLPDGYPTDMLMVGNLVYLAWWTGAVYIIDVSDPVHPVVAGRADTRAIARGIDVVDTLVYIAYGLFWEEMGMQIFDVSDPAAIRDLGYVPFEYDVHCVRAMGDYAYVSSNGTVVTVDVSDPTAPTVAASFTTGYFPVDLEFGSDDTLLYVGDHDIMNPSSHSAFTILDISDPLNLTVVDRWGVDGAAGMVTIDGDIAYFTNGARGLKVFDISDPAHIDSIGHFATPAYCKVTAVCDTLLVLADVGLQSIDIEDPYPGGEFPSDGPHPRDLLVLNVADPTNPECVGFQPFPDEVERVVVHGNYAYAMTPNDTNRPDIFVVDITDRTDPQVVGSYTTYGTSYDATIVGDLMFLAAEESGLEILSLLNPKQPELVSRVAAASGAMDVVVEDTLAYVAAYAGGVRIINVADSSAPFEISHKYTYDVALGLVINGDYLYVADGYSSGLTIDKSDPASPVTVSLINRGCSWFGPDCINVIYPSIAIFGDRLFTETTWGFDLYDVSADPSTPSFVAAWEEAGWPYAVTAWGNHAFVCDHWNGLQVVDVSAAPDLVQVGVYNTPGYVHGMTVSETDLLVSDKYGLQILSLPIVTAVDDDSLEPLPNSVSLGQNYPNPFNPTTTIAYDLPGRATVRLTIYNVLGQQVRRLIDREQPVGTYTVSWDGTDGGDNQCASGIYFYRLEVDGTTHTKKMLLLR